LGEQGKDCKRQILLLKSILTNPKFALAELLLVALSGVIWALVPEFGIWFTLIAFLPWGLRLFVGLPAFQRTPLDVLIAILLVTAWVGYWAAYDKSSAWVKVWLIVTAALLYYAFSAQQKQNLGWLSLFSYSLGLAVSAYFFLTHDFTGITGGLWWMARRPQIGWAAIHHGYICGLLVITNLFSLYWLWERRQKPAGHFSILFILFLVLGYGMTGLAFLLTMSHGVLMAMVCGMGGWFIWKVMTSKWFPFQTAIRSLFPLFVLTYLGTILVVAYLGPAQTPEGQSNYGTNSRAEVSERSAYFLRDYPITGGGLNSFPGLYSHYMLVIPIFYFLNGYNIFLDVAIEQGIFGGLALLLIYLGAIWLVARTLTVTQSKRIQFFSWLSLFALIFTVIHGFFYDYLYNGDITSLLLFPVGFSMIGVLDTKKSIPGILTFTTGISVRRKFYLPVTLLAVFGVGMIFVLNMNQVISVWYSNLGAVRMSQVELKNFPTNKWTTNELVPELADAETLFRTALQYNPDNATANYRLGMISMFRQDFESASVNLETAYNHLPGHRGVIKNLGYDYVWLGRMDQAKDLLVQIPEAQKELDVYVWWWNTQGRSDLSANSSMFVSRLTDN
jgi:hypothetical protein